MGVLLARCAWHGQPWCLSCGVPGRGQAVACAASKLHVAQIKGSCVTGPTGSLGCLFFFFSLLKMTGNNTPF